MERITRHAFFWGLGMLAIAHALLATRLVGTVLFTGVALVAIGGSYHQDRKLLARIGRPYADYLAATSAVPFAAIVAGRQRFPWTDLRADSFTPPASPGRPRDAVYSNPASDEAAMSAQRSSQAYRSPSGIGSERQLSSP